MSVWYCIKHGASHKHTFEKLFEPTFECLE